MATGVLLLTTVLFIIIEMCGRVCAERGIGVSAYLPEPTSPTGETMLELVYDHFRNI